MRTLALDVGLKRIGVALCLEDQIALPLAPILRKNRHQAADEIRSLIKLHQIKRLIVGLPKGGSSEEEMTRRIGHFVNLLEFEGELCFVDEGFTSKEAQTLRPQKRGKRDGKVDSLAAFLMLRDYFAL